MTEKFFKWTVISLIAGAIILVSYFAATAEQITLRGEVISHAVVADRYGNDRKYITIVKTEDGYIREVLGLGSYAAPIGSTIEVKIWK